MPLCAARFTCDRTAFAFPDKHYNIPGSAAPGGPGRPTHALLIRAFLRCRRGPLDCRHNSPSLPLGVDKSDCSGLVSPKREPDSTARRWLLRNEFGGIRFA